MTIVYKYLYIIACKVYISVAKKFYFVILKTDSEVFSHAGHDILEDRDNEMSFLARSLHLAELSPHHCFHCEMARSQHVLLDGCCLCLEKLESSQIQQDSENIF